MNQEVRRLRVVNWNHYQHYKNRRLNWIKLHVSLLDDYEWTQLDPASRLLAVCMMLLAAKHDNHIPGDPLWIAKALHLAKVADIETLVTVGFLEVCDCERCRASNLLATCYQSASNLLAQNRREENRREVVPTEPSVPTELLARSDADIASELQYPIIDKQKGGRGRWVLTEDKIREWEETFIGIDVRSELRRARQWLLDNPTRRKTRRGMTRYLGSWLGNSQNRSGGFPVRHRDEERARLAAEAKEREEQDPHARSRHGMKAADGRIWCSRAGGWVDASEWRPLDERA